MPTSPRFISSRVFESKILLHCQMVSFPAMVSAIIGRKQLVPAFVAKMGRAHWALHMKAAFRSFHSGLAIRTRLSILQDPQHGFSIGCTRMSIGNNPRILFATLVFLMIRRRQVAEAKLQGGLWVTDIPMIRRSIIRNSFQTEFTPRLVTNLAIDIGILFGSSTHTFFGSTIRER
jgi:hypothetical protein